MAAQIAQAHHRQFVRSKRTAAHRDSTTAVHPTLTCRGARDRGEGCTYGTVVTDAQKVAFGALTRAAAAKRTKHAPAAVIPVIFSAGGGLRACDDELLPCPEGGPQRHRVRVELSTILIKYAFKISIQFWSRRDNSVVAYR